VRVYDSRLAVPTPNGKLSTGQNRVVSIKLYVLARTTVPSAGYTDTKTYELGSNADGSPHTISAANDHLKRHVFSALVALPNPAGRKNP